MRPRQEIEIEMALSGECVFACSDILRPFDFLHSFITRRRPLQRVARRPKKQNRRRQLCAQNKKRFCMHAQTDTPTTKGRASACLLYIKRRRVDGWLGPERPRGPRGRSRDPCTSGKDGAIQVKDLKKGCWLRAASVRNAPSCGEKEADAGLAYGVEWRTPGVFLTIYNSRAAADERKNKPNWAELQQVERLTFLISGSLHSHGSNKCTHGVRWTILFIISARFGCIASPLASHPPRPLRRGGI